MSEDQVSANEPTNAYEDGRHIIIQAFEAARRSGRTNWSAMTTAVLKNRLLNVTNRAFKENDYGAQNITEFIKEYPDLLALDDSTTPPSVTLLDTSAVSQRVGTNVSRGRIRPDLWRAVMDYRSGSSYLWDGEQAIPAYPTLGHDNETLPRLPTISVSDMTAWRRSFQQRLPQDLTLDQEGIAGVENWVTRGLPTNELPLPARSLWNEFLNQQVVERLATWFRENMVPIPDDMVRNRVIRKNVPPVGVNQLRELILRCVRTMTEEELKAINLPPAAVLRAYGGGESGLQAAFRRGDM
ncbi:hypothetical protein ACFUS2_29255 [[Kitasatospora] papulosa]|uniref:hypothetical protein n=1 Tax=[Kitasatospora] papulosa TaxID=1464011 RepID=UPI00362B2969